MKEDLTWKEQLAKVLDEDHRDNLFGKNIEWHVKDVIKYISKLEKWGCFNIEILDYETIRFNLPTNIHESEILLFILTSSPKPSDVDYKKCKLTLEWRY